MGEEQESSIIDTYHTIYQKSAQLDISNIKIYIKYKLCNPIAASRFITEIRKSILLLKQIPYIGAKYDESGDNRFKIYKNFLIFYEIQEEEKLVIIKRIIHRSVNL